MDVHARVLVLPFSMLAGNGAFARVTKATNGRDAPYLIRRSA